MSTKIDLLIMILIDKTAREDERDDAAMDLGKFDDAKALDTLLKIACDPDENATILDSCGESIAKILIRRKNHRQDIVDQLAPIARRAANAFIKEVMPEWN